MLKRLIPFTVAAAIASPIMAEVTIEQLAPADTIAIVGVKNLAETMERAKKTDLYRLWQSPEMQELFADELQEFTDNLDKMYADIGVEEGSLVPPSGSAGMAVFMRMDEELGIVQPAMLAFADYRDDADKHAKLVEAMIEDAAKNDGLTWEEKDVRGRTVLIFDVPESEADPMGDDFDDFGPPMPDPMDMVGEVEQLYYTRDESIFLLATTLDAVEHGLEAIDGEAGEGIAANEDYQAIRRQVGLEHDMWGAVVLGDMDFMEAGAGAMPLPIDMEALTKLLIGNLRGFGFGADVDGEHGMVEATVSAFIPGGKTGIPALFDTPSNGRDVPSFVGPETASYARMNVDFPEIMELIRKLVRNLPAEGQEQFDMMLQQMGPMIEQGLGNMGPDVHLVTSIQRPISLDSRRTITAISAPKADAIRPLISMISMQTGLMPRDFLGHTIWSSEDGFVPMAIGLGGGHMFIGTGEDVEQALRSFGDEDHESIEDEKAFRVARDATGDDAVVAWGFTDAVADFEYERAVALADLSDMITQGLPDDMAEDLLGDMPEKIKAQLQDMTPEMLRRYVGPFAWRVENTDDGYVMKYALLRPE